MSFAARFLLPSLAASTAIGLHAAELKVTPGKNALVDAVSKATSGDTLVIEPGVYRERVRIDKSLTLRGKPGAIIDGAEALRVEWKPAGGDLTGVFTAPMSKRPRGLLIDGKFIAEIRFDRAQSKSEWNWQTLLAKGPPLSGFSEIRALWMYHSKEQRIYVALGNRKDPGSADLSWLASDYPLLTVSKAHDVVIEGLTLTHGSAAVEITDEAKNVTVRRCKVASYENTGIAITGGASSCTVEQCEVTRGAYEEWQPVQKHSRPNYEIWRIHKDVGLYDRVGIELFRAGASNRILRNHLDRVFDGICVGDYQTESLDKPLTDPNHGRGTEIAANIIENTRDSGIELGVGCIDVQVHHNTLRRTHGGFRFKAPRIGPVFIHHNRLIDGSPFNFWFSMDTAPAQGYIYHNTIVGGGRAALEYSSFNASRNAATPEWHFLNNLAVGQEDGFFVQNKRTPAPDFTAAHNVVTGGAEPWKDDPGKDKGSRYHVDVKLDTSGKPTGDSAAIDAGLDLSTYRNGKPLPGCEPGYFKGKAPDAGADEVK